MFLSRSSFTMIFLNFFQMSLKSEVSDFSVFDSHCHLEFMAWRNAPIETLSHCMERDGENLGNKFRGCIVNFCQPGQWSQGARGESVSHLLRDSARDGRIGISLGCHPHFADKMTDYRWKQLKRLVSAPSEEFPWLEVVAFGECGLDYSHKNSVDKNRQIEVFERQLKLALSLSLPLVLHLREAEDDGLAVLERVGVPPSYPIHRSVATQRC